VVGALFHFLGLVVLQKGVWTLFEWKHRPVRREFSLVCFLYLGVPLLLYPLHRDAMVFVLTLALGSTYVMVFPCASVKSPSLEILLYLHQYPGATGDQVEGGLAQADLLGDRVRDLSNERWIEKQTLTGRGKTIAAFFYGLNRLLRQPMGTG